MIRDLNDLGAPLFTFAVVSDTHVNPDDDHCNSPFPVNARANRRFRHVVADLNQRAIDFIIHLGDLVHPVPETGALYTQAAAAYRRIERALKAPIHCIPGNHDIGDTPVKGAPASPTTTAMIDAWTRAFGEQWHAFSQGGIRFLLLNAQLINSRLPDEERQRVWVEGELASAQGRVMVMLHHPPYLCCPDEPNHYDNTDPPGRDWLLELMRRPNVEAVFAGHAHNFWYDRYHGADYYLAPSTSFVRQDYSEMQRVAPHGDSEFGRDDKAKLGYFIVRVYERGHCVQIVRSQGAELSVDGQAAKAAPLAPAPRENIRPAIGFDLRRNWAEICEVPPSGGLDEFDRKPVRNDYALLALIEMGVRDIRIPLADLRDPVRRDRLSALCHLGFRPTLFSFAIPSQSDLALIAQMRDRLTDWEITVDWPLDPALRDGVAHVHQRTGLPLYLSRMRSKADLPSGTTYYHVINHGFTPDDGAMLDAVSDLRASGVAGAVFRLGSALPVRETLSAIESAVAARALRASVHLRMAAENPAERQTDEGRSVERIQEAMETMPRLSSTRLICDALVETDRGYFPRPGAIDAAGNPRALLEAVKQAHARMHG